jgi:pyruvate-ferredoxin/flavodoxin oxidoreductase
VREYAYGENRFQMLTKAMPEQAEHLMKLAQKEVDSRYRLYETLAADWPQDDE